MRRRQFLLTAGALAAAGCNESSPGEDDGSDGGSSDDEGSGTGGEVGRGRLVYDSDRTGNYEIYWTDLGATGSDPTQLTDDPEWDSWWARVSPSGERILFYRTPSGVHDTDYTQASLWVINADGGDARELRPAGTDGWDLQGHAEWSPDGDRLVMFGGSKHNPQIYVTDRRGRNPRMVTDRGGTNLDPSWGPDGDGVVFVGCPDAVCFPRDYEVLATDTGSRSVERLTNDGLRDHDPYFSPDGGRIAWLTQTGELSWDIRIMNSDGSNARWVTDDRHVNSKPEWSPDGSLIYFHRLVHGTDAGFSIYSVRPDGSGLTEVTVDEPGNNEYPCVYTP